MKFIAINSKNYIREDGQYDIIKIDGTWILRSHPQTFPTAIASTKDYTKALTMLAAIETDGCAKVGA